VPDPADPPGDDTVRAIITAATALVDRATDGDRHTVAAATLTASGEIVTGLNLYHFTGGPCAELVAFANVAAAGAVPRVIVAVGSHGRGVIPPCGRCRQVMLDYWPGIDVVMPADATTGWRLVPIGDLLPGRYERPDDAAWAKLTEPG
jgi:cytidine deaminase